MKLSGHVVTTLAVSSLLFLYYRSFLIFISSLIGGILIDADHLIDYYLHRGFSMDIKSFFRWCYMIQWKTLIIFLHSFELVFLFWFVIYIFNLGLFWIGLAIGISQHMVLDLIFNSDKMKIFSYFFTYRFIKGFKKELILQKAVV